MAINDVLPLKAAQRNAIAVGFGDLGHKRPSFDGYIYIYCAAPSDLARISAIYFLPFDNVWLGSVSRVQHVATKQNAEFTKGG